MKLIKKIVRNAYILVLMAFTVWFGNFMYPLIFGFSGKEEARDSLREWGISGRAEENELTRLIAEQPQVRKTDLGYRIIEQPYMEGHFHHVGFAVPQDKRDTCTRCHGSVPHHETRELRSFLNMHGFFLACETCHVVRRYGAAPWEFRWYDKNTGELTENPGALLEIEDVPAVRFTRARYPTYGEYGAKILPRGDADDLFNELYDAGEIELMSRLVANQDRLGDEQKSQLHRLLHRQLTETPAQCSECHREVEPYLPLADLGYPPRRIDDIIHTPVVGMIDSYSQFHLPSLLDPSGRGPGATRGGR